MGTEQERNQKLNRRRIIRRHSDKEPSCAESHTEPAARRIFPTQPRQGISSKMLMLQPSEAFNPALPQRDVNVFFPGPPQIDRNHVRLTCASCDYDARVLLSLAPIPLGSLSTGQGVALTYGLGQKLQKCCSLHKTKGLDPRTGTSIQCPDQCTQSVIAQRLPDREGATACLCASLCIFVPMLPVCILDARVQETTRNLKVPSSQTLRLSNTTTVPASAPDAFLALCASFLLGPALGSTLWKRLSRNRLQNR